MKKSPEFSIPIFKKKNRAIEEGIDDYLEIKQEEAAEKSERRAKLEVAETEHKWQSTLDDAFRQGNFDLIKTLRRSRPDLVPNRELVGNKFNELLRARPSNWATVYAEVRSVSDVAPEEQVVKEEFQKLFDKFGNEEGILDQLKSFCRTTGFQPSAEQVQEKYRSILNGRMSWGFSVEDLFKDIQSLTGVKPDLGLFDEVKIKGDFDKIQQYAPLFGVEITDGMVQSMYEAYFEENGTLSTHTVSKFSQKPSPELMQKVYSHLMDKQPEHWINTVQGLEKATGIKPQFSQEQVRTLYEKFFEHGWYGRKDYIGIEHVKEMTGVDYPDDLVQKAALKIADDGHHYIDQGKAIKDGIARFEAVVGRKIEIPEVEIQERYQQAISNRKAHVITNLYGAFGVRPTIDGETARQFMVSFVGETYHNPIQELEKVFGVAFSATDEEVSSKYNERLSKFDFDVLAKIKELTGKDCDKQKLETALIQWFEKEATVSSEKRGNYNSDWEKRVQQRLEQFNVTIPPEVAINIYASLIQNETAHSSNLIKVFQITGVPLPKDLAQQAYQKYLSSQYAYTVKIDYSSSMGLGSASSAFEKLFKISGIKPEIPNDVLQAFYRSALEEDSWHGRGANNIKKISEITGIKPAFDSSDINQLYRQWSVDGRGEKIGNIKEITGIDLDEESIAYISNRIKDKFQEVSEKNYVEKEYSYSDRERFSESKMDDDLRAIRELMKATGLKPSNEQIKRIYDYLLAQQDYWAIRIEKIAKTTNVKPEFSPEQVQEKAEKLLSLGRIKALERLSEYGAFSFDTAHVEQAYDAILSRNNDEEKWDLDDRVIELQKISGIPPTKKQLARLFSHYIRISGFDIKVNEQGYRTRKDTIEYLSQKLGIKIDEEIVQDVYTALVAEGEIEAVGELRKRTKLTAEVPEAQFKADELIEKEQWKELAQLKISLGLERLPVTAEKLQAGYIRIFTTADLTKYQGVEAMRTLFDLLRESTGIRPVLTSEQTNEIYRRASLRDWQKWLKILFDKPSNEVLQHKYFLVLTVDHFYQTDYETLQKFSDLSIAETTVRRSLEHCAGLGEVDAMKKIVEITGQSPAIGKKAIEAGYIKIASEISGDSYDSDKKFAAVIKYFYEELGVPPTKHALGLAYRNLLNKTDYSHPIPGQNDYNQKYPQWWDYLREHFGPPDQKQSDQVYYRILSEPKKWKIDDLFSYVSEFGGIKFDLRRLAKTLSESGIEVDEEQIKKQIQDIYRTELLGGNVVALRKLEQQTGVLFRVEIGEAQLLYAQILANEGDKQESAFKFLFERSEHSPDEKMIQNRYKEFFADGEFKIDEMYALWSLTGIKPAEQILQEADEAQQKYVSALKFIKFLGADDFAQLFPKTHAKALEVTLEQIEHDLDLADYFVENLHAYYFKPWVPTYLEKAVKHYSVAVKFKQAGGPWSKMTWVQDILAKAQATIDQGPPQSDQWDEDDQGYSSSGGNEGFRDSDPYEHHPYLQMKFNFSVAKILNGEISAKEIGLSDEAEKALREIDRKIEEAHQQFLAEFSKNKSVPDEDKKALADPEHSQVKMNDLLPNIRNFISRYIAQMTNGEQSRLNEVILEAANQVSRIVKEGLKRYVKIYEVDIPLYDKLYDEFDHWREAGRYPLEVYLGRDGIYAYVGRKAQDTARRSKLGRGGRKALEEKGEVFEINPKYLVYPRYFRDNLSYETKRQFLEQEGISPNADPLFYDTGYTGTIPEQIMRVMDFDTEDIERRIRLLSAPTAARRVKGIPENARSEIIEYIEHNAKTENTAEGLIIDPKTGQIRHIARPTEPEEQFYYMMIKQAVARHYFVKERSHYEPFRAVNMDSEHYGIRIVQEYAQKLPPEFVLDPKQYLEAHGTLLKGSKGEGEFPDEEVILFTLQDGTEVVAKRIELRKAKEAKKEFMILIAAKKAGLSTAEPVGFLSGKEEADGSYLLMEKLEGVSGRNFDKYLEKLGKFTEAQIQDIMKTITQKLEEQAKLYRQKLNIDKRWRVKDTIVQFNEETGEVEDVIPIDWERVKTFDPDKPEKIDTVE